MSLVLSQKVLPVLLLLEKVDAFSKVQEPFHFSNKKKKNMCTINFHAFTLRTLMTNSVNIVRNVNPVPPDIKTEGSDVFLTSSDIWDFP